LIALFSLHPLLFQRLLLRLLPERHAFFHLHALGFHHLFLLHSGLFYLALLLHSLSVDLSLLLSFHDFRIRGRRLLSLLSNGCLQLFRCFIELAFNRLSNLEASDPELEHFHNQRHQLRDLRPDHRSLLQKTTSRGQELNSGLFLGLLVKLNQTVCIDLNAERPERVLPIYIRIHHPFLAHQQR